MAAATVTGSQQLSIQGDVNYVGANSIAFAANGDTWDTKLKAIFDICLTPTTNTAFGFTVSGGVITLVSGGALTFRGGVRGKF